MAKNITIREGDTAKQFTAKKLKVNQVGGGTVNFVPEDEVLDYVDLKDHEFKENGTFNPGDFNCDGFGQVKVSIPSQVKEKTFTKNGTFSASADNVVGYSKVTIAVPAGGGGGPFTVRFFDDDRQTILKTDANVPYGGSASCTALDGTVVGGLYFKGWNPNPTGVKEDMNCYPLRGDYIIDPNEIQDDWGTICADGGAHYPLGSYKSLVFSIHAHTFVAERTKPNGDPFTITANLPAVNVAMHMVKVAEGEDGSKSSWISTGAIMFPKSSSEGWAGFNAINQPRYDGITFDWGNSAAREWLHNIMLPLMPQPLVENIKDVNKYYKGYPTYSNTDLNFVEKSSLDKIWIPSVKEFYTKLTGEGFSNGEYWGTVPSNLADMSEINGVDYSTVYVPSYSLFLLRTGIRLNDQFGNKFLAQFNDSNNKWYAWDGSNYGFPFGFCL